MQAMKNGGQQDLTDRFLKEDRLNHQPRMLIMVGFSRTGKSTWVNNLVKLAVHQGLAFSIISGDDVRRALGVRYNKALESQVHYTVQLMATALMMRRQHVIIDETNLSAKDRQRWIDLAAQHGYVWSIVEIECLPPEIHELECKKHAYPWEVIQHQKARYQPVVIPPDSIGSHMLIKRDQLQ